MLFKAATDGLSTQLIVLIEELRGLLRTEIALAKAEVSQGASRMVVGAALLVVAVIFVFVGVFALAASGVIALHEATGWSWALSSLCVAGGSVAVGVVVALIGLRRLKAANLMPQRTVDNLRADLAAAAESRDV
ncbi:phage holin family protein [Sagittula sp. SSi028]|uniref:phage holin family protein n=1 Tax=Sagittula sp. SSi028 TaxID=3400636 RepID=UPI003AF5AB8F